MKFTLRTQVEGEDVEVTWTSDEADLDRELPPWRLDAPGWVTGRLMRLLIQHREVLVAGSRKIPAGLDEPFEAYHTLVSVLRERTWVTIHFEGSDDDGNPMNYMPEPGTPASIDP